MNQTIKTSHIEISFNTIANYLLNHSLLATNDIEYRITVIELYFATRSIIQMSTAINGKIKKLSTALILFSAKKIMAKCMSTIFRIAS